jgi:putative phage-type endonuclease
MALTEKQLEERRHYIGGSDAGAILGLNPWRSALDVYFEKIEGKQPEINNNFIYWGNQLEPLIRRIFFEVTGLMAHDVSKTKYHKDYPFIAANIDGLITLSDNKKGENNTAILEIKTVSQFARAQWGKPQCDLDLSPEYTFLPSNGFRNEDGYIPMNYLCQAILYACVYEIEKVYFAVYFGNDLPLQIYQYNRDLELENQVIQKLKYFWYEHVKKEIPPLPQTAEELKKFYPNAKNNSVIISTNEIEDTYYNLKELKQKQQNIEEQIENLSCQIKQFMKDDEVLLNNAGDKFATWSNIVSNRIDTKRLKTKDEQLYKKYLKESKYRQFKIY